MSILGFLSLLVAGLSPVATVAVLSHALRKELAAHREFLANHQSVGGRPIDVIEAEFQLQRDKLELEKHRLTQLSNLSRERRFVDPSS